MSFRIDLIIKDNVHISLVVVKNQINLNFLPGVGAKRDSAYELRDNFNHLLSHFTLENEEIHIMGDDPEHIKQHHGYEGEMDIPHTHIGFDRDVTPDMLTKFLEGIIQGQNYHNKEEKYQFVSTEMVTMVLKNFSLYYKEFVGSSLQKQFLEERRLSEAEKESLLRHAQSISERGTLSSSDRKEFEACGIRVPARPLRPFELVILELRTRLLRELERSVALIVPPAVSLIPSLEAIKRMHRPKTNLDAFVSKTDYPSKRPPSSVSASDYVAAAPGAPEGDPDGGSIVCLMDDDRALPRKEIVRTGNIRFFRDVTPTRAADKTPIAHTAKPAKKVVKDGNIHFFRDNVPSNSPTTLRLRLRAL